MAKVRVSEEIEKIEREKGQLISNRTDRKLYEPGKYELTGKETFTIDFKIKLDDFGNWKLCNFNDKDGEEHFVVFKVLSYSEENKLIQESTKYDKLNRTFLIDQSELLKLRIQKCLKDWSFAKDNDNLKIFHVNNILVDECYKKFMELHPSIVKYIVEQMRIYLGE